jgi:AraC-like DNA-binding protein
MCFDATLRSGNAERLPEVLHSLGLDVSVLLEEAGIGSDVFDDPESLLPLEAVDEVLHQAETLSGCDHIGLLIGRLPADLGLPSYLFFNAPDLRTGIDDVAASFSFMNKGGGFTLEQHGDIATVRYSTAVPLRYANHVSDCVLAQTYGAFIRYCGPNFRAIEVRLPRRQSKAVSLYQAHFGPTKLVFDATEAAIDFPSSFLKRSSEKADPATYRFLKLKLRDLLRATAEPLTQRVRYMLAKMARNDDVSIDRVARHFGQSSRKLRGQLKAEGTSFSELLKDVRHAAAIEMIEHTDLPISTIAATLYYADASALTHSFRKRTGLAPSVWRKRRGNV